MITKTPAPPTLESWLRDAACSIRGAIDTPKYKEYILPLLFYKRLSDIYADEIARITREISDPALARELAAQDRDLTRVYIPDAYTWDAVRRDPTDLGDRITTAMREIARENPDEDKAGVLKATVDALLRMSKVVQE